MTKNKMNILQLHIQIFNKGSMTTRILPKHSPHVAIINNATMLEVPDYQMLWTCGHSDLLFSVGYAGIQTMLQRLYEIVHTIEMTFIFKIFKISFQTKKV